VKSRSLYIRIGGAVAIALVILVAGVVIWAHRCFREIVVTNGTYMSMVTGSDKSATFDAVLRLYRAGTIVGFTGLDDSPDPSPHRYSWDRVTVVTDRERMVLYNRWTLVGVGEKSLCGLTFRHSKLAGIGPYDAAGNVSGEVSAWAPPGSSAQLGVGMTAHEAAEVLSTFLAAGTIAEVRATEHDAAPPDQLDESALGALLPWDKWRLFTHDWGAIWLTFENGRLSKIHHRIQCTELP
jgi:hypothetical protein